MLYPKSSTKTQKLSEDLRQQIQRFYTSYNTVTILCRRLTKFGHLFGSFFKKNKKKWPPFWTFLKIVYAYTGTQWGKILLNNILIGKKTTGRSSLIFTYPLMCTLYPYNKIDNYTIKQYIIFVLLWHNSFFTPKPYFNIYSFISFTNFFY